MTYTTEQLTNFTDAQILEVFKPLVNQFEQETNDWTHCEYLWIAVADDVIIDKLSDASKDEYIKQFKEMLEDDEDVSKWHTLDDILNDCDWLSEDIGAVEWTEPKFIDASCIYLFRYMLDNGFFTDAFVNFLNTHKEVK